MAEKKSKLTLDEQKDAILAKLNGKNLTEKSFTSIKDELQQVLTKINFNRVNALYDRLAKCDGNPIIAAVNEFYYDVLRIVENRDKKTKALIEVNVVESKRKINIAEFVKTKNLHGNEPDGWLSKWEKLRCLLKLSTFDAFELTPEVLGGDSSVFYSEAKKKIAGETPDSKRQMTMLLQEIIDDAIFVDDGTGHNKHKVVNADLEYIKVGVSKIDNKQKCTVAIVRSNQFQSLIPDVFANCLGAAKYNVVDTQPSPKTKK